MEIFFITDILRMKKNLMLQGHIISPMKIGDHLFCGDNEFIVKGIELGLHSVFKLESKSILVEPLSTIENETLLKFKSLFKKD